jgi:DNA-binding response OmpR family regulator
MLARADSTNERFNRCYLLAALSGCSSSVRCFSWAHPAPAVSPSARRNGKVGIVRILVIEDEVKLATHLSRALESEGHEARVVHDGKVASVEARDGNYDLLVLDVELPRMDGFEILKQLRSCGVETRILMLTARSENPDKIAGLTGGADDYLTKPFAMNELLARVNALGRRFAAPPSGILRAGDVTLNVEEREVWRGERRIELSERECALLKVLMREPGRAFSRMELSERVWERGCE